MVLMMAWEGQKTDAAVAEVSIPQESIRLRILANSDGAQDQLVKRQIRDKIVEQMNQWVSALEDPQSLEQARALIRNHLPELNALVGSELEKRGIEYSYKVELGVVPFPTKLYGGTVYPAGSMKLYGSHLVRARDKIGGVYCFLRFALSMQARRCGSACC